MKKPQQPVPTNADGDITRSGIGTPQRNAVLSVRLLIEAAIDPSAHFSVKALANRTGMSEWLVRTLLGSPEYAEIVREQCRNRVEAGLDKIVQKVIDKSSDDNATIPQLVSAGRFLNDTLRTLASTHKAAEAIDSEAQVAGLLKKAQDLGRIKRTKLEVTIGKDVEQG